MIRWVLKLSEFNIEWEYQPGTQNVVTDVLPRNPVDNVEGSQISKASAQAIAKAPFENYISRYGAHISLISDNGPQFISNVLEHLSHRLDIKHIKTVTYRPQVNLTERVNRTLVQMIACFVEENHNWDRFLHVFSFALRTAVNETTDKTPAELFSGRKIITPFRKLVRVTDGAEYVGGNIEKLFDEERKNMQRQYKTWEKYYNRKRRAVNIKVNDLVLVKVRFISAVGRRVVVKCMPKSEGLYRLLEVQNNNLTIWKRGKRVTVNIDQVRIYHPRNSDTSSFDSINETIYEGKGSSNWSNRSNSEKSRRSRKPQDKENKSCKSDKGNAGLEDLRVKRDRAVESTGKSERSLRYVQEHQIKDRRGGPIHLNKRTVEKQEWSLTEPERPGQVLTEDTVQLRGDWSGLKGSQQLDTLRVLSKEPLQRTRRTTGGAEEYGNRQSTTEQPQ
ncbi:uncharacterized protein TNCV_2569051 [Trichonephila clavipes]|nr:uncharacterized protein TNCV_2569051 [Trichonephila clavipes]